MEVKPGYKQTEVGVIPEDWEVEPLGELVAASRSASSSTDADYVQGRRSVLIGVEHP